MQEQEIHLRDYLRVVQKRKWTVLTFFLITFTVVVIGTLTAIPRYKSSTKLLIEKNEANPLTQFYYYAAQDSAFVETQSQIIMSKRVARKVVKILELDKNYARYFPERDPSPKFLETIISWPQSFLNDLISRFKPAQAAPSLMAVAEEEGAEEGVEGERMSAIIRGGINVSPVKESKVFEVGFTSESPILAKKVANSVAKAYMDVLLEIKMNSSGHTIKWMTEKADEERGKLEKTEKQLQQYMQDNDFVTIEDRVAIVPQKLAEFSSQLNKVEARRKELGSLYKQIQRIGINPEELETISAISDSTGLQELRSQIHAADQHINDLTKKYGPKHPVMKKALSDKKILEEKRKEEIQRAVHSVKNEYELAQANEDNVRNLLARAKAEALGLNEKFVQYEALKRDAETNRVLYEALLGRLKEQDITEESQSVNVWIVEEAETPGAPVSPNKKRNILLGLVLGLFGGVGLAFFIEYLDNTLKNPEEVEEKTGLPMLGVIEQFKPKRKEKIDELICLKAERSEIAESFKNLRTSVLLSSSDSPPKSLVVTSMLPGEGKTTIATNLALTIAQAGQKVLLIDADMRKPRLHKIFALDGSSGLSTFLSGASNDNVIQQGPLETLSIMPSGPLPPNPSELLSSEKLAELVKNEAKSYDIIIFDSTPIISVTDSLIVSKVVDGAIIVCRANETTYEVVGKGVKSLLDINTNIFGMVLNAFDARKYKYYYGRYYHQYYGKYYGTKES